MRIRNGEIVVTKKGRVCKPKERRLDGSMVDLETAEIFFPECEHDEMIKANQPLAITVDNERDMEYIVGFLYEKLQKAEIPGFDTKYNYPSHKRTQFVISPAADNWIEEQAELYWPSDSDQIIAWLEYNAKKTKTWDEPTPEDKEWRDLFFKTLRVEQFKQGDTLERLGFVVGTYMPDVIADYIDELESELRITNEQLEVTQDRKNELREKVDKIESALEHSLPCEEAVFAKLNRIVEIINGDDIE